MAGARMDEDDTEARIRAKAHALWEAEGRPEGRADSHWVSAREMVAIEDSHATALKPLPGRAGEPVEPALAAEAHGDMPGLTDQGDAVPAPSVAVAADHADGRPESGPARQEAARATPARPRKPAAGTTGRGTAKAAKGGSAPGRGGVRPGA